MSKKKNLFKYNLKKILKIIIMFLFILTLVGTYNSSFASDSEVELENNSGVQKTAGDIIMGMLNGLLGIFLWIPVAIGGLLFVVVPYLILSLLFKLLGNTSFIVTPADIFYNRIPILSIDFFDFSTGGSDILSLRTAIAKWFVTLSGISVVILLGVLIYISIRAVIASTGQSRAKYYKMFVNWLISLALLALLGIIIVASITGNNILVRIIEKASMANLDGMDFAATILKLMGYILTPLNIIRQLSSAIILATITIQTFKYTFIYIKRMIKIAFLIMISPLITITYSIDKIADNKSQALNTWMHVFIFNVFIQTFHALIFSVFFTLAFKISVDVGEGGDFIFGTFTSTIPGTIIAIMSLGFIGEGEKIIRQIFNITDGEKLPAGGQLAKATMVNRMLDKTSERLKRSAEKQEKPRLFERSTESTKLPPKLKEPTSQNIETNNDLDINTAENVGSFDTNVEDTKNTQNIKLDPKVIDEKINEIPELKETSKPKSVFNKLNNLYSKNLIRNVATVGGAIWSIASGDALTSYALINSSKDVGEMLDKRRESRRKRNEKYGKMNKKDRYILNTKNAAKEAINSYGINQMINGEVPELETQEGIDQMQSWFRMVGDKSNSGKLLKEYEQARKKYLEKVMSDKSLTKAQATVMAYRLEESLMNGKLPKEGTMLGESFDTLEGRNFGSMIMEKKQMEDMEQYNGLESDIKKLTYDYDNVQNVLKTSEVAMALKEYSEENGDINEKTLNNPVSQQGERTAPESQHNMEDLDDLFKGLEDEIKNPEFGKDTNDGEYKLNKPEFGKNSSETDYKVDNPKIQENFNKIKDKLRKAEDELEKIEKENTNLKDNYNIVKIALEDAKKSENTNIIEDLEKRLKGLEKERISLENGKLKEKEKEVKRFKDKLEELMNNPDIDNPGISSENFNIEGNNNENISSGEINQGNINTGENNNENISSGEINPVNINTGENNNENINSEEDNSIKPDN